MNQPLRQVTVPRYLLHLRSEPVPHPDRVMASFKAWLAQQDQLRQPRESGDPVSSKPFTDEQRWWLQKMAEHIAASLGIEIDDFDLPPFSQQGGLGRVHQLFGAECRR